MVRKYDIITRIYENDEVKNSNIKRKTISLVVDKFISEIKKGLLKDEYIELRRFGSFMVKVRKNRKVWDPKIKQVKSIKEKKVPYFKPSTTLKAEIKELSNL